MFRQFDKCDIFERFFGTKEGRSIKIRNRPSVPRVHKNSKAAPWDKIRGFASAERLALTSNDLLSRGRLGAGARCFCSARSRK